VADKLEKGKGLLQDPRAWKLPDQIIKILKGREPYFVRISGRIDSSMIEGVIEAISQITLQHALVLVFDSSGGEIQAGKLLISHLKLLQVPVIALAAGKVGSMALVIYLQIPKANRFALVGSTFLAHFVSGGPGVRGQIDINDTMSGLDFESARIIFEAKWHKLVALNTEIKKEIKSQIGDEVKIIGKKRITTDRLMASEEWLPEDTARAIGIVGKIV